MQTQFCLRFEYALLILCASSHSLCQCSDKDTMKIATIYIFFATFSVVIVLSESSDYSIPSLMSIENQTLQHLQKENTRCMNIANMGFCSLPLSHGFVYADGCLTCSCFFDDWDNDFWDDPNIRRRSWYPEHLENKVSALPLSFQAPETKQKTATKSEDKPGGKSIGTVTETCSGSPNECRVESSERHRLLCFTLGLIQQQHLFEFTEFFRSSREKVNRGISKSIQQFILEATQWTCFMHIILCSNISHVPNSIVFYAHKFSRIIDRNK